MTCTDAQQFGGNANPIYHTTNLLGHPGVDVHCGYGTDIAALADGQVFSLYTPEHPASDGYTAIFTVCSTSLEDFEFSYGHVSSINVHIGDTVNYGDIIGKEGNKGPVYSGNRLITLAEQAAGNTEGSHRHYQKRPIIKAKNLKGLALQSATGIAPDHEGYYYQIYDPYNGYAGCVDWKAPLFPRDLTIGSFGYDVYLLQKALNLQGFASFAPSGTFGPRTLMALIAAQRQYGYNPTGYCGPKTRATLNSLYSQL